MLLAALKLLLAKPYGSLLVSRSFLPSELQYILYSLYNSSSCKRCRTDKLTQEKKQKKNRSTHRRFVWWLFFWTLDVAVGGLGGVGGVKVLAGTWTAGCNSCQENDVRTAVGVTTSLQQVWYTSSRQDCPLTQEFLNTFRVLGQIWSDLMITNTPQKIRRKKFRMT